MLAVLHVLLTEDRVDRAFVAAHSTGFEQLEAYVLGRDGGQPRTPGWAEPLCGVAAEEITRFARAYAAAKPAMLLPGYSIQRVYAGEEPYRLAVALQLATGNFGVPGGSTGSLNNALAQRPGRHAAGADPRRLAHRAGFALARRGAGRARGRVSDRHPRHLQHRRQLPQPGQRDRQEHRRLRAGGLRRLPRTLPDPHGALLRCGPARGARAREGGHRPDLGRQLHHLQSAGGPAAGRGAHRLRHPVRPGRAAGLRRAVLGRAQRGASGCSTSWINRRCRTTTRSVRPGSTARPTRSGSGLADFAAIPRPTR